MPTSKINFVGQAYNMPATQLDAQTCINWYVTQDPTGKFPTALLPRSGLSLVFDDNNEKSVRGMLSSNGILYVVIDNKFFLYYSNGIRQQKGTLTTSIGRVNLIANGTQIFISDEQNGYVYTLSTGVFSVISAASSQIGDPVFSGVGINDLTVSGTYTDTVDREYIIKIEVLGSPDTFQWSDDGGITYTTGIAITGNNQPLSNGVVIKFEKTSGHVLQDIWTIQTSGDDSFYPPIIATYQDGYGIYPKQDSERFYISSLGDFSRVNALDYATINAAADFLVGAISIHQELWFFGNKSIEVWYNTGNVDFPFERRTNLVINYGCVAPYSIQDCRNNVLLFLGHNVDGNRAIFKIEEYVPSVISTEPLNIELDSYQKVDDAFGMVIEKNSHIFYVLTFPSEDKTWAYDVTTSAWSSWSSKRDNPSASGLPTIEGRFRGNCYTVFDGKYLIGDYKSGKIFKLDDYSSLDYDTPILCERSTPHIQNNLEYFTIYSLEIAFESGEGVVSGEGYDPQAMLQVSRDGGKSWGDEMWRSIGKTGKYKNRAIWYHLGTARVFTFRLRMDDPVYKVVMGAVVNIEGGS